MDEDAGPVARPYMVTGGRTRPVGELNFEHLRARISARHLDRLLAGAASGNQHVGDAPFHE